jgi:predicted ATP-grasp superfamily ATP-dependent carboligase
MPKNFKALITDATYLHSLAIARYLAKKNIDVFVLGEKKSFNITKYSRYCKKYFNGPNPKKHEKLYINSVLNILIQEKINIFIPVSHIATEIASKYKKKINKISKTEVADHNKIEIALNKKSTYELAEKIGVPCPKTFYPKSVEEIEKISQKINYPSVIKWLLEVGGNIVVMARNKQELIKKYREICQKYNPPPNLLPMIQEFIPSLKNELYCFSVIYQKSKCKKMFMQKQIRNTPVNGGACSFAKSCYIPEIKNYSIKLLNNLNWHGVALIEFKLDKRDNLFKLMEINPKFWASTDMALKAGVNFPYLLCQMAQGKTLEYSEHYDRNLKFHFPFSRELKHIKENPKAIWGIFISTVDPSVKSNIWLKDILPNLIELTITIGSLLLPNFLKNFLKKPVNDKN